MKAAIRRSGSNASASARSRSASAFAASAVALSRAASSTKMLLPTYLATYPVTGNGAAVRYNGPARKRRTPARRLPDLTRWFSMA